MQRSTGDATALFIFLAHVPAEASSLLVGGILDRTSLPLVQHRLPANNVANTGAEHDTGEATSRSGLRRRSFPTSGNVLVRTFLLVQHSLTLF